MKSIKILATVGAIALLGMTGLTSCNQKNGPVDPKTGNYNGETVKTEFSISIPTINSNGGVRRLPSTTVQRSASEFQGLADITLVPFAKQQAAVTPPATPLPPISGSDARLGENIVLLGGFSKLDYDAANNSNAHAKVYENVAIPLSTASFLFYAKSAKTGDPDVIGALEADIANTHTNPSDFTFDLVQIVEDPTTMTTTSSHGGALLACLNAVASADDDADKTDATPGTPWYSYTAAQNASMKAMFDTYSSMHGLSSFEVARVLSDLYTSIHPQYGSNTLVKNICDAISNDAVVASVTESPADSKNYVVTLNTTYNNFPGEHNIPDGAIHIQWDGSDHQFKVGTSAQYATANMAYPDRYVYPSQLWYFVNSAIQTSNISQKDKYNNTNNYTWEQILAFHTNAAAVNSLTRAVAIKDVVQYAVARFDVQVNLDAAELADNSLSATGKATGVDCSAGFTVTGVLVGNQKQVGFDFTPTSAVDEFTIYDKSMTPTSMKATSTAYSDANSTLVLETLTGQDVKVAIEMVNDAADFYGVNNQLIPHGGKFYVVGTLEADDADETGDCVFKQDFTTTAKFTLKDLKKAYNTIPDLRTPKLELGFSVDLTWQSGHTYTIDFD